MAKMKKTGKPAANKKATYSEATVRKAAAIVGQVLAHFGAGYAVAWERSRPSGPFPQIFKEPSDLATFHHELLHSVLKELDDLNWDIDRPNRNKVCSAAFQHGTLAFDTNLRLPLEYDVILSTLRVIQTHVCPDGAGGGPVCRF